MRIYLLTQESNLGYDTFDAVVVAAKSEGEAKLLHPNGLTEIEDWKKCFTWANSPDDVICELIGTARPGTETKIISASFNAG